MFTDNFNNKHITNEELMTLRQKKEIQILDVRELFEYNICHIPGSTLFPLNTLIHNYKTALDKNTTYYILCHTGQRSYYITDFLTKNGYSAINILGGIADNQEYNVPY